MTPVHRELAAGHWVESSHGEQWANVGSAVERAMSWRARGNDAVWRRAFERALEWLALAIADARHRDRLKERTRVRELPADDFWFDDGYGSTDAAWRRYFHAFTDAAAIRRGRQER